MSLTARAHLVDLSFLWKPVRPWPVVCSGLAPVYPFLVPVSVILISTMCACMRSYDQFFRSREESSRLALAPSLSSAIGSGRVQLHYAASHITQQVHVQCICTCSITSKLKIFDKNYKGLGTTEKEKKQEETQMGR